MRDAHLIADELTRNLLLRRVDWRFLLPHAMVDGLVHAGAEARLVSALSLVSQRVEALESAASASADLAVLVDPNQRTLRAASRALRPCGTLYVEWTSPLRGGVRALRQRLQASGFVDAAYYWAWPPPASSTTRFWVPLDS